MNYLTLMYCAELLAMIILRLIKIDLFHGLLKLTIGGIHQERHICICRILLKKKNILLNNVAGRD